MPERWPSPIKLSDLLERASRGPIPEGWLYLPGDWKTWNRETPAYMLVPTDENIDQLEREAAEMGYESTIEDAMVQNLVTAACKQLKANSFEGWLDVLTYYVRFDNFPPKLGAPDPPTGREAMLLYDRKFYDSLGEERAEVACSEAGCTRGAINFSVMCKVHHFEQIKRRPCPFND